MAKWGGDMSSTHEADAAVGPEPRALRLVVAGANSLARDGMALLLSQVPDVAPVEAVAPDRLRDALAGSRVDAVILILLQAPQSGPVLTEVAETVMAINPVPALVVLAPFRNGLVRALMEKGPPRMAYLGDRHVPDAETLVRITRDETTGIVAIDSKALAGALGLAQVPGAELLTRREHEVLAELAEAKSNRTIAADLGISTKSVEANVTNVFRKLGLEDDGRYDRRVRAARLFSG